ncbi:MAG: hypothetical protein V7K64_19390 [Nostoc sp.]|uniref:hypothetical protein n=1 Tax=Nostoc sp. TaxID=1180 RepID=UPI002FF7FAB0
MVRLRSSAPKFQPPTTKESNWLLTTKLSTGYRTDSPKQPVTANTAIGGKRMTRDTTRSPWLEGANAMSEDLKTHPPEVQAEIRRLSKAIREKEQEQE